MHQVTFKVLLSVVSITIIKENFLLVRSTDSAYDDCTFPPKCANRVKRPMPTVDEEDYIPREPCFCEGSCHLYGDCCPDPDDYVPNSFEKSFYESGREYTCSRLVPENVQSNSWAVYMVNWCPYDSDKLLAAKCTKDVIHLENFNYSYLLDVPVISSNSGIVYQNIFCGTCNKEYYFNKYEYKFGCDCEMKTLDYVYKLNYIPTNLTWTGPAPENVKCMDTHNVTCKLEVDYPSYVGHPCEENLFDECPKKESGLRWKEMYEGCMNGDNYYVQDKHSNVYKNEFCASCNGVSIVDTICLAPKEISNTLKPVGNLYVLSDLFDVDDKDCEVNQVQDPIFGTCENLEDNNPNEVIDGSDGSGESEKNETAVSPTYSGPSPESIFFVVMMSISIICLFLHMIIFIILYKESNMHSKNLFSMSLALFLAEIFFVFGGNFCNEYLDCYIMTVIVYYCFLSSFFWMNVISYDICRTFHSRNVRSQSNRRFLRYWFYAWGIPIIMTLCAIFIDLLAPASKVAPGFALHGFWFSNLGGLIMFFIIPAGVIFFANMIMFILSIVGITKQKKVGKFAASSAKKNKAKAEKSIGKTSTLTKEEGEKVHHLITGKIKKTLKDHESAITKLKLHFCLAVLMGIPWIFAVFVRVSVAFEYLCNIFNSMQGIFIFIAFDCKSKTFRNIVATCSGQNISTSSYYSTPKTASTGTSSTASTRMSNSKRSKRDDSKATEKTIAKDENELHSMNETVHLNTSRSDENLAKKDLSSSEESLPPYDGRVNYISDFQQPRDDGTVNENIQQSAYEMQMQHPSVMQNDEETSSYYEPVGRFNGNPQEIYMNQYSNEEVPRDTHYNQFQDVLSAAENQERLLRERNAYEEDDFPRQTYKTANHLEDYYGNEFTPEYHSTQEMEDQPVYDVPKPAKKVNIPIPLPRYQMKKDHEESGSRRSGRKVMRNSSLRKALSGDSDSDNDVVDV